MELTSKQEAFCQNIAEGKNITQSALAAGYSKASASSTGSEIMKNPKIVKRIEEIQDSQIEMLQRRFVGHAEEAIKVLMQVLVSPDSPPQTKTHTAKVLLDYAGFKPVEKQETKISGGLSVEEKSTVIENYLRS